MRRILVSTLPFLALALIVAGPASATSGKVTCKQIRAALASGKSVADVEKEMKVSKKTVDHCNAKVASSKKQGSSAGQSAH